MELSRVQRGMACSPASEGNFLKSSSPYSTAVTGIYSTKPGVVLKATAQRQDTHEGRGAHGDDWTVPTKVSAENGPIKPGDLLVTSSKPGDQ